MKDCKGGEGEFGDCEGEAGETEDCKWGGEELEEWEWEGGEMQGNESGNMNKFLRFHTSRVNPVHS